MGELFAPTHLLVLGVVALLFFGGKKLPELGKGLGEGLRGFKEGVKGIADEPTKEPNKDTKMAETGHIVTPPADQSTKPPVV